jgi:hypothetical protein
MAMDEYSSVAAGETPPPGGRRLVSTTSLYDTAIGFYPVLLGLILTDSLKTTAENVVKHPWFGADWSLRFLTLSLLLFSALWLHVWIATFRGMTVRAEPGGDHADLPGHHMKKVKGYGVAVGFFWLGVIQLVLFACMAYSVSYPKEYFVESAVYGLVLIFYTTLDWENISDEAGRKPWWHPWESVRALRDGRHIPISRSHLDEHFDRDNQKLKLLLAQGRVLDVLLAVVVMGLSLLLYALSAKFGAAWWIALLALAASTAAVATDYYIYPYFYLA